MRHCHWYHLEERGEQESKKGQGARGREGGGADSLTHEQQTFEHVHRGRDHVTGERLERWDGR
jgi:hypothetical protein